MQENRGRMASGSFRIYELTGQPLSFRSIRTDLPGEKDKEDERAGDDIYASEAERK
ncbi:hypothetical protein D3C73_1455930 [compost metagenome]